MPVSCRERGQGDGTGRTRVFDDRGAKNWRKGTTILADLHRTFDLAGCLAVAKNVRSYGETKIPASR